MSQLKHPVVMLPSKYARLSIFENVLSIAKGNHYGIPDKMIPQHLYILSDGKIEEGDWCINKNQDTLCHFISGYKPDLRDWNKVIASTDVSIYGTRDLNVKISQHIHGLSQGFIEAFIKQYNLGTPITNVMVEYEENYYRWILEGGGKWLKTSYEENIADFDHYPSNQFKEEIVLKLRPDNTIITHPVEVKTYTEAECKEKARLAYWQSKKDSRIEVYSTGNKESEFEKWWKANK